MDKLDFKKDAPELYRPRPERFCVVDVPAMSFLMVDGSGDPNTSDDYARAVAALYSLSYTAKFAAKARLGRDHVVAPLEGLWWADDMATFHSRQKDRWSWTMMIRQPDWIDANVVEDARAARLDRTSDPKADAKALSTVRLETFAEGRCVQALHIGPYDDEGPLLEEMHDRFIPAQGLRMRGKHHEIYLSDPRRTDPSRLRTILRQPVE
ncbi:GyrI-like domain-containing protein [Rhizobiaceae bacterium]|nr:GyrI-like domain-containing protein [Rhizobiaceae bacterium]